MAEQKTSISELTAATTVATTDLLFISQGSGSSWTSKKATVSQLPFASSTHVHGNIQNGGTLQTTDVAVANGDKLVVTDASNSNKVARTSIAFDGSTTTQFLSKKGTWESAVPTSRTVAGYQLTADVTAANISSAISLSNYSLTSHTHSDYSLTSHNHSGTYAPATHAHGNIQSGGTLQTTDVTIASGDKLVVTDSSDSSKVARTSIAFDGSTTTKFLSQKGTWESVSVTGYVSKAELTAAVAAVGAVPSGDGATLSAVISKFNSLVAALTALAT